MATETQAKGKPNGKLSTGGLNRPGKFVKMIQARCRICNPAGQGRRGWWDTCPHDPYFHIEEVPGASTFEEDPETGVITKLPAPKTEYRKVANFKQIADMPQTASARMVQIQKERGSKFPEDLGYAPICDYRDCWEINPTVHGTRVFNHDGA